MQKVAGFMDVLNGFYCISKHDSRLFPLLGCSSISFNF